MATKKLTDADYAEMAADYEAHPPTADEVVAIEVNPGLLRMGRPAAEGTVITVRLPEVLRDELKQRADEAGSAPSELIRVAIAEYFANHPATR